MAGGERAGWDEAERRAYAAGLADGDRRASERLVLTTAAGADERDARAVPGDPDTVLLAALAAYHAARVAERTAYLDFNDPGYGAAYAAKRAAYDAAGAALRATRQALDRELDRCWGGDDEGR